MITEQDTREIHSMVCMPGNGTRYFIVWGEDFVALPDFRKSATMTPFPYEWSYIAEKLDLSEADAHAVFTALHAARPTP